MKRKITSFMSLTLSLVILFSFANYKVSANSESNINKVDGVIKKASIEKKQYAFRKSYWGDSIKQVKKVTKSKLEASDKDLLMYKTKMLGYPAEAYYSFEKKKLTEVFVSLELDEKYHSRGQMESLHKRLAKKLKKDLNTKSKGEFFSTDDFLITRWDFKSREVVLSVGDKNIETSAMVYYSPN